MDATLPLLDGIAATRQIRESPTHFAAGGDEYLSKPFALSQLEGALERCLGRSVLKRE
jgi:CheY-like chemotaxis protein